MNRKVTVRRDDGRVRYCILSGDGDLEEVFNLWLFGSTHPEGGYRAKFHTETIEILDCIAYETVTTFELLSVEDTDEATSPYWTDLK